MLNAVAPYVGAWIETLTSLAISDGGKTSHPTWVRGLKQSFPRLIFVKVGSHPTWVRGLKLNHAKAGEATSKSHPTWVRGLKLDYQP